MPNHVRNVLKVKGNPDEIIRKLTSPRGSTDELLPSSRDIDFDKIIPEPKTKEDCPERYLLKPEHHVQPIEGKEWFNWYNWRIENWDTKWEAYDCYLEKHKSYVLFVFCTAWSMPLQIYKVLAKEYDIEVRYADEDLGNNCGKLVSKNKILYEDTSIKNKYDFANRIWKTY